MSNVIFQKHYYRLKELRHQIQMLMNEVFREHDKICTEKIHNKCLLDAHDERLLNVVMLEREEMLVRRELKRDIKMYETDPEEKRRKLDLINKIEELEKETLSGRKEYAEL
jgi:hypothetical protein